MDIKKLGVFLWKLRKGNCEKTNFENFSQLHFDYRAGAIYSRMLFKLMNENSSQGKLISNLEKTCKEKPQLEIWIEKMGSEEQNFQTILKLNLINEKARPLPV